MVDTMTNREFLKISSVAVALLFLGGVWTAVAQEAYYSFTDERFEIGEDRSAYAALGQKNNLDQAPEEPTEILDSFFAYAPLGQGAGLPRSLTGGPYPTQCGLNQTLNTVSPGEYPVCFGDLLNTRRYSAGILPDVILPGAGNFYAWFGNWTDINQNQIIDRKLNTSLPDNEFLSTPAAKILSFVEPGSHPTFDSNGRPDASTPDFFYSYGGPRGPYAAGQNYFIWFYDGSLLRDITVRTTSNADLTPSEGLPFTCGPKCLQDYDLYEAMAPQPAKDIYGSSVGPVVDNLPVINFGVDSDTLRFLNDTAGPIVNPIVDPILELVNDTAGPFVNPILDEVDQFVGARLSSNENELDPANRSSDSVYDYKSGYHVWFNANARVAIQAGVIATEFTNSWGSIFEAKPSAPPGWVKVSGDLGVWYDRNGDGVIQDSEFKGACIKGNDPPYGDRKSFNYTLVPKTTWGDAPILEWQFNSDSQRGSGLTERIYTGSMPIEGYMYCYKPDEASGWHPGNFFYLFPLGVPDFDLLMGNESSPVATLDYHEGGIDVSEPFWDSDAYYAYFGGAPSI